MEAIIQDALFDPRGRENAGRFWEVRRWIVGQTVEEVERCVGKAEEDADWVEEHGLLHLFSHSPKHPPCPNGPVAVPSHHKMLDLMLRTNSLHSRCDFLLRLSLEGLQRHGDVRDFNKHR